MSASPQTMTTGQSSGSRDGLVEIQHLTKRFGRFTAVEDLSFTVTPGRITGFLGPNGAGKTTTLRMLLGLISITSGTATISGRRYRDFPDPLHEVGAALESTSFHPGRTGRDHLRVLASAANVPVARVDELLEMVGIPAAAKKRVGGYSMGMRQRLGLASILIGDPRVLLLDEPANGLDPEGIRWLRGFLRELSRQGKTILVSSHMLSEVQQTVDDVVIIANGRTVMQGSMTELESRAGRSRTIIRTPDIAKLGPELDRAGLACQRTGEDTLDVATDDPGRLGDLAFAAGARVHELRATTSDLEQMFLDLTTSAEHQNRNLGRQAPPAAYPPGPPQPMPGGPAPAAQPWGPGPQQHEGGQR